MPTSPSRADLARRLAGVSAGFVFSDLAHHFLVLPLLIGDIGWHWP